MKKIFSLLFVLSIFVFSFAFTGQIDSLVKDQFKGEFKAHENNASLFIEKNGASVSDMELFINGMKVNIFDSDENVLKVNVSKFVVDGVNDIAFVNKSKKVARVVVPFITLEKALPEKAGMNSDVLSKIDAVVEGEISKGITPGAVVLIAKDGYIVKEKAYGFAQKYDIKGLLKDPVYMNTNTIFDLASVTKVMATTQSIMSLISEGKINSVEDKVIKYLPEFGKNGKENITIADLLTHTSGLTPWKPTFYHVNNRKEELDFINNLPLEYETGTDRRYSDFSFMALGFIVEAASGMPMEEYAKTIYNELNMVDTGYLPSEDLNSRIAATSWGNPYEYRMVMDDSFGYKCEESKYFNEFNGWRNYVLIGQVNDGNAFYANHGVAGHAGLFSTTGDLAILGQTMLNGGGYDTTRVYDEDIVKEFTSPKRFGQGYGFEVDKSWYMGSNRSKETFGHTGFTGTQVIFDPNFDLQIIILTNKQHNGVNPFTKYNSTGYLSREVCNIVYESIK
ncbi:serine hydrolase [Oceanotoga sp. DSM 15011]|jgi:CubicO group peptidase (beta-lactamase class C family)|uniref:CubicO group peptidase (Beta-lactamase class C family) n=1 Tax=Oceanotoga teriensis TaxID=515440 RepID=A0AA45HIG9_9BACT|nr:MULTISPECIES: serine hydrolase [Oceanotoga]MDO7975982.1 serine hydrolase [Oceanotoga teriensis]PWJ92020.1 CubicO group peptidase (beta-lactamase class C family) [Oceanotoga teriensis]UYO99028.1 serine hydrolase [Oceanotoga sp. DSM 15011]